MNLCQLSAAARVNPRADPWFNGVPGLFSLRTPYTTPSSSLSDERLNKGLEWMEPVIDRFLCGSLAISGGNLYKS